MDWPRVLTPVAVLCGFALLVPVRLPQDPSAASSEECLTLADTPPVPGPNTVATLERCSALYPTDVELLSDLAAQYESSEPARSEAILHRALVIDPDDADLRLRLGRLLLRR